MVLRDGDAASAAGGDDPRRAATACVQRDRGGIAIVLSQTEPRGDTFRGRTAALAACRVIIVSDQSLSVAAQPCCDEFRECLPGPLGVAPDALEQLRWQS
ncbi:MAG: hypothetical protein IT293_21020 [Deltaproteobacteria bacterium]|nr:hypothetical protein [Deltaproteobacteria bacterium]